MRRVRASIKAGRRGKRNKGTKGLQGGGAPRGAGIRPGRVSPGQESPVLEKQELHQSSWTERHSQRVGAGSQGGDALRLPGTLTEELRLGRVCDIPRLSSQRAAVHPGWAPGAAQRRLHGRGLCPPEITIPAVQALEPRAPGDPAQDPALPSGQAEAGRAQDSKDAPAIGRPRAEISGLCPRSIQAPAD